MDEFLDNVANEVLVCVFKNFSAIELAIVAQTCRRFRAAAFVDQIWQEICRREYNVHSYSDWVVASFRELYTTVLYRYGCSLGTWKCNVPRYGGLVHIKIENGSLLALDYRAPYNPQVTSPLRPKPLFSLTLKDGQLVTKCLAGRDTEHEGSLEVSKKSDCKAMEIQFFCHASKNHSESMRNENSLRLWIKEEYNDENLLSMFPHLTELVLMRYSVTHSMYKEPILFSRLQLPGCGDCVINPGVFKGTYSSHGIELILITVCQDRITGTKITGDPNIPAGQITFNVDLHRPVGDTGEEEEQHHINSPAKRLQQHGVRNVPFHLPDGYEAEFPHLPPTCCARYHGVGQIASHGYHSPQWTPGQLVVFNMDSLGFLWQELMAFSFYSRAEEDFLQGNSTTLDTTKPEGLDS